MDTYRTTAGVAGTEPYHFAVAFGISISLDETLLFSTLLSSLMGSCNMKRNLDACYAITASTPGVVVMHDKYPHYTLY